MKNFTQKTLLAVVSLFMLLFSSQLTMAQVLLQEDFSTASGTTAPTGWVSNTMTGLAEDVWHYDDPGSRNRFSTTHAIFDSDNYSNNSTAEDVALESPEFAVSAGATEVRFSYYHYFNEGYGGAASVEVFNGTAWVQVASYGAETASGFVSINIADQVAGVSNAKVRFRWTGNCSWYWAVDNVTVKVPTTLDVAFNGMASPTNGTCAFTNTETVTVQLYNDGTTTLDLSANPVTVTLAVTGASTQNFSQTFSTGTIDPAGTLDLDYTATGDFTGAGNHVFAATVTLAGDGDTANNNGSYTLYNNIITPVHPYFMGFESSEGTERSLMWETESIDANDITWGYYSGSASHTGNGMFGFNFQNAEMPDDWIYSRCIELEAGTTYRVSWWYRAYSLAAQKHVRFYYGDSQEQATYNGTMLEDVTVAASTAGDTWTQYTEDFTVPSTGTYYFGWWMSDLGGITDQQLVLLDDFEVKELLSIEMAADEFTAPVSGECFSSSERVAINVSNQGTGAIDFSVNPLTVSCAVTGVVTQNFDDVVVNTGTLAPGATLEVEVVASGFDMTAVGVYNFAATIDQDGDDLNTNDAIALEVYSVTIAVMTPYSMGFEQNDPAQMYDMSEAMKVIDANSDGKQWSQFYTGAPHTGNGMAAYNYNGAFQTNDWLFSRCFNLEAGKTYEVSFWYKALSETAVKNIAFYYGTEQTVAAMTNELFNGTADPAYVDEDNNNYYNTTATITPGAGTFYFAWHLNQGGVSAADQYMLVDDLVIRETSPFTWTGETDTDWNNAGNWSGGAVPTASDDAVIPTGLTNYPALNGGDNAQVSGLLIESGATLAVPAGKGLTTNGSLVNDGTLTMAAQNNSDLPSGSYIDNGTVAGNGTYVAERYLSKGKWHMFSSPIATTGANYAFHTTYVRNFDQANNQWGTYMTSGSLEVMQGYDAYRSGFNAVIIEFTGTYNTGNLSTTISTAGSAWNLVGNPYPSAIDWTSAAIDKSNTTGTMYVWDPTSNGYLTHDGTVGTGGLTEFLPSFQAFFVKATGTNFAMTNAARTHTAQNFHKGAKMPTNLVRIQIQNGTQTDEAVIYAKEGASTNYDLSIDSDKLILADMDDSHTQLFTMTDDDVKLAINVVNTLDKDVSIPLGIISEAGSLSISAFDVQLPTGVNVYLEDHKTATITNLGTETYDFEATGNDDGRFTLHFTKKTLVADVEALTIYSYDNQIVVKSPEAMNGTIAVYNLLGAEILKKDLSNSQIEEISLNQVSGTYLVKVLSNGKYVSQKVFIR